MHKWYIHIVLWCHYNTSTQYYCVVVLVTFGVIPFSFELVECRCKIEFSSFAVRSFLIGSCSAVGRYSDGQILDIGRRTLRVLPKDDKKRTSWKKHNNIYQNPKNPKKRHETELNGEKCKWKFEVVRTGNWKFWLVCVKCFFHHNYK